nr:hypothetical protein [Burkholderia ambifaria]
MPSTRAATGVLTFVVSLFRGERGWIASTGFSCARRYRAIPLWMRTDDPTMSICLVMLIELAGLDATYAVPAQVRAEHIECRGCVLSVGQQLREDRHLLADDGAASGAVKSGVVSAE